MSPLFQPIAQPIQAPQELADLLGFSAPCPCGRVHSVQTRTASIREGAVEDVVPAVREVGRELQITLVADRVTVEIAGDDAARHLFGDGHRVDLCIVPDGPGGRPHADDPSLAIVDRALERADLAVAAGSGTINDLTKLASFNRGIPYVAVATAPSMNGYTSAIAAIMRGGVKRTVECHQPMAIIADLDILCNAPHALIAAGLGDLESKPTATADFHLAKLLRDTYYCPAPQQVGIEAEKRAAQAAEGLGRGDPESIAALTEALILSGISMKLAGSSGPASGGEHLISHYWDMTAEAQGRIEGWHGAQVGVTTIVTATLYERLRTLRESDIDVEKAAAAQLPPGTLERAVSDHHGAHADEVLEEIGNKTLTGQSLEEALNRIKQGWTEIWAHLSPTLRPAREIRAILETARAPTTVQALGLTPDHLRQGFLRAREIRNRYTVLDLAAELDVLASLTDEVLEASGCLAAV